MTRSAANPPPPAAPAPRLTMANLARDLGLSRRTVSSVVNGKAAERAISPATAQRVRDYLQQRGYVPSKQAVALKNGARGAVGVLHSGRLYSHLVDAFNRLVDETSTQPAGVEIVVTPRAQIAAGFRELVARGVAKLVWIQTQATGHELELANQLLPMFAGRTVVLYNHHFDRGDGDARLTAAGAYLVGVDRAAAYEKQARFLKRLGHRRIAFPDARPLPPGAHLDAKSAAFQRHGLELFPTQPPPTATATPTTAPHPAAVTMARALHAAMRRTPITAAVFQDDLIAAFAMAELARLGVRIPHDLTVMGFDGLDITQLTAPTLTSLRIPVPAMVDRVLQILQQPPATQRHCFAIEIATGGSHARAHTPAGDRP